MYVLIAFFVSAATTAPNSPVTYYRAVAMQEFKSKARCQAAADLIRTQTGQEAYCLLK